MAQSSEPKKVHDVDPIWGAVETLGSALAEDRRKASASELAKWKETGMILSNNKPDTDDALTARPVRSPVR